MNWFPVIASFLILNLTGLAVKAAPAPFRAVPDLVSAADLVIVGRSVVVESRILSGRKEIILLVTVDRVLKGKAPDGSRPISLEVSVGEGASSVEKYGIFFLHSEKNGLYTPATPNISSVIAIPRVAPTFPDEDPVLAVAEELAAVLGTPVEALSKTVEAQSGVTPTRQAEQLYFSASNTISHIPVAVAVGVLKARLESNQDILSQCWIISTLLRMGVPASMEPIKRFIDNPIPATDLTRTIILVALESYEFPGREMVPALIGFLGSSDVEFRRATAHALSRVDTAIAVKALAQIALQDEDSEVRADAESGLCNAMPGQAPLCDLPVRPNEAALQSYWMNWARGTYQ